MPWLLCRISTDLISVNLIQLDYTKSSHLTIGIVALNTTSRSSYAGRSLNWEIFPSLEKRQEKIWSNKNADLLSILSVLFSLHIWMWKKKKQLNKSPAKLFIHVHRSSVKSRRVTVISNKTLKLVLSWIKKIHGSPLTDVCNGSKAWVSEHINEICPRPLPLSLLMIFLWRRICHLKLVPGEAGVRK